LQQSLLKHEARFDSRIQVDYLVLGWKIDRVKTITVFSLVLLSYLLSDFQCSLSAFEAFNLSARQSYGE